MHLTRYIRIQSDDPIKASISVSLLTFVDDERIGYAIDLGNGQVEILTLHDAIALYDALTQLLETQPRRQP